MRRTPDDRTKGIVALITLALVFASMGIFARYLQFDFTILQQVYLRITAAFLLGPALFWKDLDFAKLRRIPAKEWGILLLRALSLYVLGVTLISKAFTLASYSNVSFVSALPLTAVLGFVLLRERLTWRKAGCVLLGFAGVVLVAVTDYTHLLSWGRGEVLALAASVFFSLSYILRKFQSNLLNNKEIAVLIFGIAALLLISTSLAMRQGAPHFRHAPDLLIVALAGLFNVVNLFLTNYGFQKVDAVLASNLLMLETAFAVVLGFLFFFEVPSLRALLGGSLIVLSAYLMDRVDTA